MKPPDWLRALDHTADEGIVVRAGDMAQLFVRAAVGMFSVIADLDLVRPAEDTRVEVRAADLEALMVRWLSELNFRHQTEHRLFCQFEILSVEATRLAAVARGEAMTHRHVVHTEIKAVTYHGLRVTEDDQGWVAQVIFDV